MTLFAVYDHLPKPIRSALNELEQFINEVDGKTLAIPSGDGCFIDDGVIVATDLVESFNQIVVALGSVPLTEEQKQELLATRCPGGGYTGQPKDQEPTVQACLAAGVCGCIFGERAGGAKRAAEDHPVAGWPA